MRLVANLALLPACLLGPVASEAQSAEAGFRWPDGKCAAVSVNFDDARPSQVDTGLAVLARLDARATFYVVPVHVEAKLSGWKKLVAAGHEIGNHSVRHPCTGNFEWSREAALENYTLERMRQELLEANRRLEQLLGITPATFAYPCGQAFVGRGSATRSYVPLVAAMLFNCAAIDSLGIEGDSGRQ